MKFVYILLLITCLAATGLAQRISPPELNCGSDPCDAVQSPSNITFSGANARFWSYETSPRGSSCQGQYFKINGSSAETGWLEVPYTRSQHTVNFWFTDDTGARSDTVTAIVKPWCGACPSSQDFQFGECKDGVLKKIVFFKNGRNLAFEEQIDRAKQSGVIVPSDIIIEIFDGRELEYSYRVPEYTFAEFNEVFPVGGTDPVDPPVEPDPCKICETYPQYCPEECQTDPDPDPDPPVGSFKQKLFLKTVKGFDTGVLVGSLADSEVTNVTLRFYSADPTDLSKAAVMVKEVKIKLGPQVAVSRMVRATDKPDANGEVPGWGVLQSSDSVTIISDQPVKATVIWTFVDQNGLKLFGIP